MGEMKNLYKFTDGKSAGREMGVHEMMIKKMDLI
jgi:hypothetical protein